MKTMVRVAVAFVIASFSVLSYASYFRGDQLKEWADADDKIERGAAEVTDFQKGAALLAYVGGVADALDQGTICVPQGVKINQLGAIVKKFLRDNPEKWNAPAVQLVVEALLKPYPCRK